jgi:CheY-like chemotaxis protein
VNSSKPAHILYADDDEDDHIFFKEVVAALTDFPCKVTSTYNGAEMLDFLLKKNKFQKNTEKPDFVIMDLNMPILDGFDILKEMQENAAVPKLHVYVLSVSDKEHDKKKCEELGCAGFYTKPVNFSKLTSLIKEILQKERKSFT